MNCNIGSTQGHRNHKLQLQHLPCMHKSWWWRLGSACTVCRRKNYLLDTFHTTYQHITHLHILMISSVVLATSVRIHTVTLFECTLTWHSHWWSLGGRPGPFSWGGARTWWGRWAKSSWSSLIERWPSSDGQSRCGWHKGPPPWWGHTPVGWESTWSHITSLYMSCTGTQWYSYECQLQRQFTCNGLTYMPSTKFYSTTVKVPVQIECWVKHRQSYAPIFKERQHIHACRWMFKAFGIYV